MNLLERAVFVLVGLILIIFISVLFIVPDALAALFLGLADVNSIIRLALALVFNAMVLAAMYLRLRPGPTGDVSGLVVKTQGALADVSVESAREMVLSAVSKVPGVSKAEVKLQAVRGKADIELDVTVLDASTNVPQKQSEINRALKQVVNKQLGLRMAGRPRVHIHLGGDSSRKALAAAPEPAAASKSAAAPENPAPESADKSDEEASGMFLRQNREVAPSDDAGEDKPEKSTSEDDGWLKGYVSDTETEKSDEEKDTGRT